MAGYTFRKATAQDIPFCAALLWGSEIQKRYYPKQQDVIRLFEKAIQQDNQLYLACCPKEEVAGVLKFVPGGFCGLYPYIALLAVAPAHQGQGVAGFLTRQALCMAKEIGSRKIALLVSDFNKQAIAAYQRLGFSQVGFIPNAVKPGIGEYLMVLAVRE